MIVTKSESGLVTVSFVLVLVHILVSLVYTIVSFKASSKSKDSRNVLLWSGFGWLVSLLVCVVVAILLYRIMAYEILDTKFPCPLQISTPGGNDRKDIEQSLSDPAIFGNRVIQPYNKNRTYVVVSGYYLKNEKINLPDKSAEVYKKLVALTNKYQYVPMGFLDQGMIFSLSGEEIWPKYNQSSAPPQY